MYFKRIILKIEKVRCDLKIKEKGLEKIQKLKQRTIIIKLQKEKVYEVGKRLFYKKLTKYALTLNIKKLYKNIYLAIPSTLHRKEAGGIGKQDDFFLRNIGKAALYGSVQPEPARCKQPYRFHTKKIAAEEYLYETFRTEFGTQGHSYGFCTTCIVGGETQKDSYNDHTRRTERGKLHSMKKTEHFSTTFIQPLPKTEVSTMSIRQCRR